MIESTEKTEQNGPATEAIQETPVGEKAPRKRRPRSRKPKKEHDGDETVTDQQMPEESAVPSVPVESGEAVGTDDSSVPAKSRSRRRRSRRGKRDKVEQGVATESLPPVSAGADGVESGAVETDVSEMLPPAAGEQGAISPTGSGKRRRRRRKKRPAGIVAEGETSVVSKQTEESAIPDGSDESGDEPAVSGEPGDAQAAGSGKRRRRRRKGKRQEGSAADGETPVAGPKQKDRTKRILINARYEDEKRVSIVEGDRLVDFYVELSAREHLKGNIYKGVVTAPMPGLQAAFVDFGQKKHGFIKYREVMPELFDDGKKDQKNGMQGLVKGQEILVQVIKDERDTKGASLTTYISLPGRYIVMMPGQKRVGISRKIENREDRDRLKETFHSLKLPKDTGFILRTACSDSLEEELSRDLKYLTKLWDRIKANAKKEKAPALVYKEQDIAMRTVRDYLSSDVAEVLIDDAKTFKATQAFLKKIMPWRQVNLTNYTEKQPLFSLYNLEAQIAKLSHRIVNLPSRGYLVFDKAEAMTVIDVNSGRSRKEENIEATALTTNLEAAEEVARQLRLRDIGGLVAIDFIDMELPKNRKMVESRMQEMLSTDKASTEIAGLSKFCILELTRERIRPAYAEAISRRCPLCEGIGTISSDDFVAIGALREMHALASVGEIDSITCRLPVESANVLMNTRRRELSALEQEHDITITILADPSVPAGQCVMESHKIK